LVFFAWALIGRYIVAGHEAYNVGVQALQYTQAVSVQGSSDIVSAPGTDSGLLWLVNQDNPLPPTFAPQYLVTHQGVRLHASAHTAYTQMIAAMKAEGGTHGLQLISAYRPYDYQQNLFYRKTSELISQGHSAAEADELASKSLQRPGASEHQTGLALDVTVSGHLTQDFSMTMAGQWLAANSHRFGFIIRYPMHKTEITQIIYEPWHLRYVGTPHAEIIWENGITLEEYRQFIAAGPYIQRCKLDETNTYYLVKYSEFWPQDPPPGLKDISSIRHGGGVGYIITLRRSLAE